MLLVGLALVLGLVLPKRSGKCTLASSSQMLYVARATVAVVWIPSLVIFALETFVATVQVIWPYLAGEVIVQNYNAVLSLARIYTVRTRSLTSFRRV